MTSNEALQRKVNNLNFARGIVDSLSWNLQVYGRPRINLGNVGLSTPIPSYTLRDRVVRSSTAVLALTKTEVSVDQVQDLVFARQVLRGTATHIQEYGHARLNLHLPPFEIPNAAHCSEFIGRLDQSYRTIRDLTPQLPIPAASPIE
jgi:hypothetical protein